MFVKTLMGFQKLFLFTRAVLKPENLHLMCSFYFREILRKTGSRTSKRSVAKETVALGRNESRNNPRATSRAGSDVASLPAGSDVTSATGSLLLNFVQHELALE